MSEPPSSTTLPSATARPERDPSVSRTRITCALLYFAARQLPVPFLDDLLRTQVAAYMVRHTVKKAGLEVPTEQLAPLFGKDEHWAIGCLWALFKLPLKLLLFPIRKLANIVFAVRHLGKDLAEILLLGEVLDRAIAHGDLRAAGDDAQLARSRRYRRAFDRALADTDTSLLWSIVGVAMGPLRGLTALALRPLRALWHGSGEEAVASPAMQEKVGRIEAMLMQPEVKTFIADFDRRFEAVLAQTT